MAVIDKYYNQDCLIINFWNLETEIIASIDNIIEFWSIHTLFKYEVHHVLAVSP